MQNLVQELLNIYQPGTLNLKRQMIRRKLNNIPRFISYLKFRAVNIKNSSTTSVTQSKWKERWIKSVELMKVESKDPTFWVLQSFLFIGVIGSMIPNELYLRYGASISALGCILMNSNIFHKVKIAANLPIMVWDSFRFLFHSKNIARIWHENEELELDSYHEQVYNEHFSELGLKHRQFIKVLQKGNVIRLDEGAVIFDEKTLYDENNAKIYFLLEGEVDFIRGRQYMTTLKHTDPLCIIGDNICLDLVEDCLLMKKMIKKQTIATTPELQSLIDVSDTPGEKKEHVFTKAMGHCIIPKGKKAILIELEMVSWS